MPTPNQDRQDPAQPIEDRLRQALNQRAQQVSPSPEAFFTINKRINRRESASAWSPRSLWERRVKVRLQPSVVLSLVLLVALSVVTTLLVINGGNTTQAVRTAAPVTTDQTSVTQPEPTEATLPDTPPADNPASETEAPSAPDGPVVITTDTTAPPEAEPPTTTAETPPTTAAAPATTAEPLPDTVPDLPPTEPTEPPQPTQPASLFEVYPLQVASSGFPIVYAEHRSDSEQLSRIPVRPDPELGPHGATLNTAVSRDGVLWGEVLTPEGQLGWVQLKTVSIQPAALTAEQTAEISQISATLLEFIAAANQAQPDNSLLAASARNLQLSSRGMYIATVQGGAAVYEIYTVDMFVNSLLPEAPDDSFNSRLLTLRQELSCLSQAGDVTGLSDSTPPAAMQVLSYISLNDSNGCEVLVYFDFLSEHPEIIGFSIHN